MFKKILLSYFLVASVLSAHDFNYADMQVNHEDAKGMGKSYNFLYTQDVKFLDGTISVAFKAISGRVDQGGGIMYRASDDDNYYVARYNPLEDNFRIYYVEDGYRSMMKSAHVRLDNTQYHTMKLVVNKNHYKAYLDDKLYLEGDDDTFTQAGGVGVWSKADAFTKFRNLQIK
jgi:hypothetical protein